MSPAVPALAAVAARAAALVGLDAALTGPARELARRLYPVAFGACDDRALARGITVAEVEARTAPRPGALRPRWCPRHDFTPDPGCAWCAVWATPEDDHG